MSSRSWAVFSSGSLCVAYDPTFGAKLILPTLQVPETKGLTLEEMDEVFGDETHGSVADAERLAAIHKRIGLTNYSADRSDRESKASNEKYEKPEHTNV